MPRQATWPPVHTPVETPLPGLTLGPPETRLAMAGGHAKVGRPRQAVVFRPLVTTVGRPLDGLLPDGVRDVVHTKTAGVPMVTSPVPASRPPVVAANSPCPVDAAPGLPDTGVVAPVLEVTPNRLGYSCFLCRYSFFN